jgi:ATP-dependent DNA helicase RecG
MNEFLNTDIKFLQGVGPKRAELLASEIGVATYGDLLSYYPFKHIDRSRFYKISELNTDLPYIQIKGFIRGYTNEGSGKGKRLSADFSDESGTVKLVWFKGLKWIPGTYPAEKEYVIFGKPSLFNGRINITHPEIENAESFSARMNSPLQAQYNTTERLKGGFITSKFISKCIGAVLSQINFRIPETLPPPILKEFNLTPLHAAIKSIHFPSGNEELEKARYRLKFEELFYIQLSLLRYKAGRESRNTGFVFGKVGEYFNNFYHNNLPFELTGAQKRVVREIRRDMGSGKQMNRLLQGDVGSGKTMVALMAMLIAADNGYQSCLMAPTEILALQHYRSISRFLEGINITSELLTGSTKRSDRVKIEKSLSDGSLKILIGTHALIEDNVTFSDLGLVIIDEQHRFGVAQRAKLWEKSTSHPHVLVMTATPIPRTLAMTLYGDLDVSVIDELPPGRVPIKTMHFTEPERNKVFGFIRSQIVEGRQIFIVYPLIFESEKMDYRNLDEGLDIISHAFPPPDYCISVVHGKMTAANKDISMKQFAEKKAQIMVATTVIEVGVDIPNATVMIIESAERFGLSQLHQLRGRVGRGASQSYCILMSPQKISREAASRIEVMTRTSDGFEIAETDLQLRGPGDLEGTQQSGIPFDLRISNLAKDGQIIERAREAARKIIANDPGLTDLSNSVLSAELKKRFGKNKVWSSIS